jgi:hypothetical protein
MVHDSPNVNHMVWSCFFKTSPKFFNFIFQNCDELVISRFRSLVLAEGQLTWYVWNHHIYKICYLNFDLWGGGAGAQQPPRGGCARDHCTLKDKCSLRSLTCINRFQEFWPRVSEKHGNSAIYEHTTKQFGTWQHVFLAENRWWLVPVHVVLKQR